MSDIQIIYSRLTDEVHEAAGLDICYRLLGLVAAQSYAGAMLTVALFFSCCSPYFIPLLPRLFHCPPSFSSLCSFSHSFTSFPVLLLLLLLHFCLLRAFSGTYGFSPTQTQSQYDYGMSQAFWATTQSEDVNDALLNLDRVLQGESVCLQHTQLSSLTPLGQ